MCTYEQSHKNTLVSTKVDTKIHKNQTGTQRRKNTKKCSHDGCTNNAKSRGLCKRHGGGMRCQAPGGCNTSARPGGFCIAHGGGLCKVEGCRTGARTKGLCSIHRRKLLENKKMQKETSKCDEIRPPSKIPLIVPTKRIHTPDTIDPIWRLPTPHAHYERMNMSCFTLTDSFVQFSSYDHLSIYDTGYLTDPYVLRHMNTNTPLLMSRSQFPTYPKGTRLPQIQSSCYVKTTHDTVLPSVWIRNTNDI